MLWNVTETFLRYTFRFVHITIQKSLIASETQSYAYVTIMPSRSGKKRNIVKTKCWCWEKNVVVHGSVVVFEQHISVELKHLLLYAQTEVQIHANM